MAGLSNGHAPAALSSLLDRLLDPGPQGSRRERASLAGCHLSVAQDHQGRDGLHPEPLREFGRVVHVDLDQLDLAGQVGGQQCSASGAGERIAKPGPQSRQGGGACLPGGHLPAAQYQQGRDGLGPEPLRDLR